MNGRQRVSIHAPARGATCLIRCADSVAMVAFTVSIHAPRARGATSDLESPSTRCNVFLSSAPRAGNATDQPFEPDAFFFIFSSDVSIPRSRAGSDPRILFS